VEDVVVGILAIIIGGLFCFSGWLVLRVIIPIWGAFAGFAFGAGLVASIADESFLGTALGWIVGLAFALLFGLIAYLYYEVAVVLAMAAIGFTVGAALLTALGVTWSWLVVLAGLVLGAVLGFVAVVGNMPMVILVVLSAFAGSATIVAGLMLLFGVVDLQAVGVATTERLDDDWWWWVINVALAVAGIVAQLRTIDRMSQSAREAWTAAGGRELRTA
jgi:hypothetical protein